MKINMVITWLSLLSHWVVYALCFLAMEGLSKVLNVIINKKKYKNRKISRMKLSNFYTSSKR